MDRIVNPKFDDELTRNFMLKLLPIQILLAAVPALNGIVSAYFASNNVGVEAMSAVGLYSPIATFVGCLSSIMVGGSAILCGQYAGRNERDRLQNIFSLNLAIAVIIAIVMGALLLALTLFDLTGFITTDPTVRPLLNQYLIGQVLGILPSILVGRCRRT